jgi:hypothetical protein
MKTGSLQLEVEGFNVGDCEFDFGFDSHGKKRVYGIGRVLGWPAVWLVRARRVRIEE